MIGSDAVIREIKKAITETQIEKKETQIENQQTIKDIFFQH